MNTKHIRQRFVRGLLAVLSVTSLALLLLQFAIPSISARELASLFQSGKMSMLELYVAFAGGGSFCCTDYLRECLLVTLVLMVVLSLFSLRMSRETK